MGVKKPWSLTKDDGVMEGSKFFINHLNNYEYFCNFFDDSNLLRELSTVYKNMKCFHRKARIKFT